MNQEQINSYIEQLKKSVFDFPKLPFEARDNEAIVDAVLPDASDMFRFASMRLRDNDAFVALMATRNHKILRYASLRLRDDKAFFKRRLTQNLFSLV